MDLDKLYAKYSGARTGQDLVDLGVKPKDASEMLTVITGARLVAIRDQVSASLDERLVGEWMPTFSKEKKFISYKTRGAAKNATSSVCVTTP